MNEFTRIIATGMALPRRAVPNSELSPSLETTDAWIVQRTGIENRYIAAEDETTETLATDAARQALERAGLTGADIDLIVVATSTPALTFPATATMVQAAIGMHAGSAFDVQAVCTGFVYALTVADSMLKTGHGKRALVIGAETFSRILDWQDRSTCVLFGDGAGAVILEAFNSDGATPESYLIRSCLRSDGTHRDKLYVDAGPGTNSQVGMLRMQGRDVYRLAVGMVPELMRDLLEYENLTSEDVDWFVPHQANLRIIEATAKQFGWGDEKVVKTVMKHANTSAASIPLALATYDSQDRFSPGDMMMLEAMGGGFTWGALLLKW